MATYPYTGRVTDFGEAPFPSALPRLTVEPEHDAFTPAGIGSRRRIPIPFGANGLFSVDLYASIDLKPPSRYILRCDWFTTGVGGGEVLAGWSEWRFTAAPGGGPVNTMPDAKISRFWVSTSPPPVDRKGIFWINPETGEVRVWSE